MAVIGLAVAADLCWGEPPAALHPVVWMGRLIGALERRAPAAEGARLAYGAAMAVAAVAPFTLGAWLLERLARRLGLPGVLLLAGCLKPVFAIRMLFDATARVGEALAAGNDGAAREALRSLVSRDTSALAPPLLAAAAIESVAENFSDSVVAPLCYFALWGLPGATAYRVLNTLDAMVGYRTERYERLGKAAARLDDLANLLPARLAGLLLALAAPLAGGSLGGAWRAMRRDRGLTASPNAGWPMSAAAGALGVTLEKVEHYRLNSQAQPPDAADVRRAIILVRTALVLGALPCWLLTRLRSAYDS